MLVFGSFLHKIFSLRSLNGEKAFMHCVAKLSQTVDIFSIKKGFKHIAVANVYFLSINAIGFSQKYFFIISNKYF